MKTIKVKVSIRTDKVGSECVDTIEFDPDEWEGMSDDEREHACQEVAFNYLDWGWEVLDENDN